nr:MULTISPECIES: adenosylcobinamide-GDP ribazoletransferase [unclassified Ruegeria]
MHVHKNDTQPISRWDIPLAFVLLTRLPTPRLPETAFARQATAVWAFPIVGLVVGALATLTGWLAIWVGLPAFVSAALVVSVLIVVTGAMHEDGLADMFDGLWGGYTTERRLEIMKDSQIGTYGVLAIGLVQTLRITGIAALIHADLFTGFLAACMVSRSLMPVLMHFLPNARKSGLSQSVGRPPASSVGLGLFLAVSLAGLVLGAGAILPVLLSCGTAFAVAMIAKAKIGGQTGDILGATQQLTEVTVLLTLVALL